MFKGNRETTLYPKTTSVLVCLLLIIFGGTDSGEEIKLHGYDFEQIVSTTIHSRTGEINCSLDKTKPQLAERGAVPFKTNYV